MNHPWFNKALLDNSSPFSDYRHPDSDKSPVLLRTFRVLSILSYLYRRCVFWVGSIYFVLVIAKWPFLLTNLTVCAQ